MLRADGNEFAYHAAVFDFGESRTAMRAGSDRWCIAKAQSIELSLEPKFGWVVWGVVDWSRQASRANIT